MATSPVKWDALPDPVHNVHKGLVDGPPSTRSQLRWGMINPATNGADRLRMMTMMAGHGLISGDDVNIREIQREGEGGG
ncbi:hypothetical protein F2Q69_00014172 [Brassica cretica]|uniref:Uncharacterized protein n=1 Tax=Brassica cretica TaxID=69181 RepID=A0A8S9R378_BRACR|nr:hypothetical protein F2Q69_00014172 [Brassica cretica]